MEYRWAKLIRPVRKVCSGLATRLGIRKNSGILKLRNDVQTCEYEDVHKMWEMLIRNETGTTNVKETKKKRPCWNILHWATQTPYLCRKF